MTVAQDDLPEGWKLTNVGAVLIDIQTGFASGVHNSEGSGLPHLRPMNVSAHGKIDRTVIKSVEPSLADRPERRLQRGDVLFNNTNSLELVGKTAYFDDEDSPAFSNHMTRLRTDSRTADPAFLARYLHACWTRGDFTQLANNHVSQASVGRKVLAALPMPLPPLPEQQDITRLLDQIDNHRDAAGAYLATSAQILTTFRGAVISAACSGRLTADWRAMHTEQSVNAPPALSAQATKNTSGSPNTSELVDIPDTWAFWPIESITDLVIDYRGRTPPSVAAGPIPHVRTTQIRDGRIEWNTDRFVTEEVYERYMTRGLPLVDDVLYTMEAPMGEVGVVDRNGRFSIAQRILLLRPAEGVAGRFLALVLQSQPVRRAADLRATGSGVVGIAYKRLRSVEIPRPPFDEQTEIVRRVEALLKRAEQVGTAVDHACNVLDQTGQAALARAFRGELLGGALT